MLGREVPTMTDETTTTPAASMSDDAQQQRVAELVARAHAKGGDVVGPDGLLAEVTKRVPETGLEVEMSEHHGYDKHAVEGRDCLRPSGQGRGRS